MPTSPESRLQRELRQNKPFATLQTEAVLNIVRTADQLRRQLHLRLKPFGLTETQYNSLRILRGAGEQGLTCAEVGERLIRHDPDITRLLDRMERQGLVRRERSLKDRRVVLTRITALGLEKLQTVDPIAESSVKDAVGHLSQEELRSLIHLMERTREGIPPDTGG
jgi:DNA-binding MarR family transcriptional regulator